MTTRNISFRESDGAIVVDTLTRRDTVISGVVLVESQYIEEGKKHGWKRFGGTQDEYDMGLFRVSRSGPTVQPDLKTVDYSESEKRAILHHVTEMGILPWRRIEELNGPDGKYDHRHDSEAGMLIMAPELVDGDCNVHGIGMGYYQDDGKLWNATDEEVIRMQTNLENEGSWMACKWSMTNDEWAHVCCTPTHYLRLRGLL